MSKFSSKSRIDPWNVSSLKIDDLLVVSTLQRWVENPALTCRRTCDSSENIHWSVYKLWTWTLCVGHSWVVLSYGLRKCQHTWQRGLHAVAWQLHWRPHQYLAMSHRVWCWCQCCIKAWWSTVSSMCSVLLYLVLVICWLYEPVSQIEIILYTDIKKYTCNAFPTVRTTAYFTVINRDAPIIGR